MKPYKFDFMKDCGYISKNNIIMTFDGILHLHERFPEIKHIKMVPIKENFLLYLIKDNRIMHQMSDDSLRYYYDKILNGIINEIL